MQVFESKENKITKIQISPKNTNIALENVIWKTLNQIQVKKMKIIGVVLSVISKYNFRLLFSIGLQSKDNKNTVPNSLLHMIFPRRLYTKSPPLLYLTNTESHILRFALCEINNSIAESIINSENFIRLLWLFFRCSIDSIPVTISLVYTTEADFDYRIKKKISTHSSRSTSSAS